MKMSNLRSQYKCSDNCSKFLWLELLFRQNFSSDLVRDAVGNVYSL